MLFLLILVVGLTWPFWREWFILLLSALLWLLVILLVISAARADPPPIGSDDWKIMMPYRAWVEQQHDTLGRWCCDIGDGRPVEARIVDKDANALTNSPPAPELDHVVGTHWEAHITPAHFPGETDRWVVIPPWKIVSGANPTGMPLLWMYRGRVQCFAPPAGV